VRAYEVVAAAKAELPPGVVRLGRKQSDGRIVPVHEPTREHREAAAPAAE
jgi:hypothetical protein